MNIAKQGDQLNDSMTLSAKSHTWRGGSGIALQISASLEYELLAWDSKGETWIESDCGSMALENVYRIFTEFNFSTHNEHLIGHLIGPEDDDGNPVPAGPDSDMGEMWLEISELAYSLSYCGGGLESVEQYRISEMLHTRALESLFECIGVDLEPFRVGSASERIGRGL